MRYLILYGRLWRWHCCDRNFFATRRDLKGGKRGPGTIKITRLALTNLNLFIMTSFHIDEV